VTLLVMFLGWRGGGLSPTDSGWDSARTAGAG
jgi:hypothetical protein